MPAHVDVTWVALECRMKQESGSDEVFGTVSASSRQDGQSRTRGFPEDRTFFEMGETDERIVTPPPVLLYSGPPVPLDLTVTLVEFDADPAAAERYKGRVAETVASAAGALAASFTSGASGAIQPLIDDLARGLVDVATDVLGTGNDAYNPATLQLPADVLGDPRRPRHKLEHPVDPRTAEFTDMIAVTGTDDGVFGADRGEYRLYFDVRVTGAVDTPAFTPVPVRTARIDAAHSGKVLDVLNAATDNEAPIVQFDAHGGLNQRWRFDDVGDGHFRIVAAHSGKVLDVFGFSMDNSARIIQFEWHGGANQKWRVEDVGDGLSKIVSVHSGKVLDVDGASTENLAPVVQFDFVGGSNQLWRLTPVVVAPFDPTDFPHAEH